MGSFSNGKGKLTPDASLSRTPPPPPPLRGRPPGKRERLYVPMHQARWHWRYRQPVPYQDVNLPHGWHLGPHRIQLLAVPPVGAGHTKKVWRRSELLTTSSIRIELSQLGGLVCIEDEEERRRRATHILYNDGRQSLIAAVLSLLEEPR